MLWSGARKALCFEFHIDKDPNIDSLESLKKGHVFPGSNHCHFVDIEEMNLSQNISGYTL